MQAPNSDVRYGVHLYEKLYIFILMLEMNTILMLSPLLRTLSWLAMHPGRCCRYFSTFYSMVEVYPLKLLATESMAMDWRSLAIILSQGSANTLNKPRNF